jgi:hypothetical protein
MTALTKYYKMLGWKLLALVMKMRKVTAAFEGDYYSGQVDSKCKTLYRQHIQASDLYILYQNVHISILFSYTKEKI